MESNIARNRSVDFNTVDMTLSELGFTDEMKLILFKLLACILHLGNIQFRQNEDRSVHFENDLSKIWFESSVELLQVEPEILRNALFRHRLRTKDAVM